MSPLHRLLHQRQQMPGHRAPRGCQGRDLMLVARRVPEIDLEHGGGLDHVEARRRSSLTVLSTRSALRPASRSRRSADAACRRGSRALPSGPGAAPPIGEHERIDEVRHRHLGAVLERRGQDLVEHLRRGEGPGAHRLERAGARLREDRIDRDLDAAGLAVGHAGLEIDAVGDPAGVERERDHRRIGHGRPDEPARGVGEAGDRIPGGFGPGGHPEVQTAVPGIRLELHGAEENRRVQARLGVEGDVLDAVRERAVGVLLLHRIADHQALASAGQRRNQAPFQVHPLRQVVSFAPHQARMVLADLVDGRRRSDGGRRCQQPVGLEPAFLDPGRPQAVVEQRAGIGDQLGHRHFVRETSASSEASVQRARTSASATRPLARTFKAAGIVSPPTSALLASSIRSR